MASTELVATLIAGPETSLSPELLQKIKHEIGAGARSDWLAESRAADIFVSHDNPGQLLAVVRNILANAAIDVIVQPAAKRRKKLLAADMESTIIEQELLDELAGEIGARDKVAGITRRSMNGEIDFIASLRERVALFKDQPVSILEKAARSITDMPGAAALVATMKANNATCWLVTGGFSFFAASVAVRLRFDCYRANELLIKDEVLTGEAREPILDRNMKKILLEQACAELNLSIDDSICVGDGANDVPMLQACHAGGGLGIAYHAKPKVREMVPNQINYADLTGLLFAQGYKTEAQIKG